MKIQNYEHYTKLNCKDRAAEVHYRLGTRLYIYRIDTISYLHMYEQNHILYKSANYCPWHTKYKNVSIVIKITQ